MGGIVLQDAERHCKWQLHSHTLSCVRMSRPQAPWRRLLPMLLLLLGRVFLLQLERFQQTEERLQAILQSQARQSEAGARLSSKDWAAFRQRLTRQWALRYHKIGR